MVFILTIVSTVTGIIQTVTAIDGLSGNNDNDLIGDLAALCRNISKTDTCTIVVKRA